MIKLRKVLKLLKTKINVELFNKLKVKFATKKIFVNMYVSSCWSLKTFKKKQ